MVSARVLVTDAETPAALAVTRSLSRAGHQVIVLAHDRNAAAAASRHAKAVVLVPDSTRDPAGWKEALRRVRFDLFLPVTDTAMVLTKGPAKEADKVHVLTRAEALGIPVLARWTDAGIEDAPLPAVLKPRRSRATGFRRVAGATALVTGRRETLVREAAKLTELGLGAYVEPWVPGEGRGVFLLLFRGEVLARFAHRRIREASPLGGPSAVCESVPLDPDLLERAEALARDLAIEGPFMAEFRGADDEFVLLEMNARYWGSLGLAIDAGVDFPALHVRALLGDPVPGPEHYRIGLRRRNLAFDLRHAARVLAGRPDGLAIPWPGRIRTVAGLLGERAGGLVYRRADPAPGRAHALSLLRKAVARA